MFVFEVLSLIILYNNPMPRSRSLEKTTIESDHTALMEKEWPLDASPGEKIHARRFEESALDDAAMKIMVAQFGQTAMVNRILSRYQIPASDPENNALSSNGEYSTVFEQYRLLRPSEEYGVFQPIKPGMAIFRAARGKIHNLSDNNKNKILLATASRQVAFHTNLKLSLTFARAFGERSGMPLDDIIQAGHIGLSKAITRFDVARRNKFSTVASRWIKNSITREYEEQSRIVRFPEHIFEKYNRFTKAVAEGRKTLMRRPSPEEISSFSGLSAEDIEIFITHGPPPKYLDEPLHSETTDTLGFFLSDEEASEEFDRTLEEIDSHLLTTKILSAAHSLKPRNLKIYLERHGLSLDQNGQVVESSEPHELAAIGKKYGLTREAVRKIVNKTYEELQHKLKINDES